MNATWKVIAFALGISAVGCGGGSGPTEPPPPPPPPTLTATASASPSSGFAPLTTNVTCVAGGTAKGPLSCRIDFGDGTPPIDTTVNQGSYATAHVYQSGTYAISVRVSRNGLTAMATTTVAAKTIAPVGSRSLEDRPADPDKAGLAQIHVIYALCNGCPYPDKNLDTNGQIKNTLLLGQQWLAGETGGYQMRFDTYQGEFDITFYQVRMPATTLDSTGSGATERIYNELVQSGFDPNKLYLIFYEGGNNAACGGAGIKQNFAGLFLNGLAGRCTSMLLKSPTDPQRYGVLGALHEVMHAFGFVASNAPNHACGGHVAESNDLMFGCPGQGWDLNNVTFDVGRNTPGGGDYFGPNVPAGVLRFENIPYVVRLSPAPSTAAMNTSQLRDKTSVVRPPLTGDVVKR